jgi:hypothetical protein
MWINQEWFRFYVCICIETRLISICFCLILFSFQSTIWSWSCLFSSHSLRPVPWQYMSRAANKTEACGAFWAPLLRWCFFTCKNTSSFAYTPLYFRPCVIFSLLQGERTPGWHPPDPGYIQEQLGTGYHNHRHWSVRHRLPPMTKAKQNVCQHRRWICAEIIRKFFFF